MACNSTWSANRNSFYPSPTYQYPTQLRILRFCCTSLGSRGRFLLYFWGPYTPIFIPYSRISAIPGDHLLGVRVRSNRSVLLSSWSSLTHHPSTLFPDSKFFWRACRRADGHFDRPVSVNNDLHFHGPTGGFFDISSCPVFMGFCPCAEKKQFMADVFCGNRDLLLNSCSTGICPFFTISLCNCLGNERESKNFPATIFITARGIFAGLASVGGPKLSSFRRIHPIKHGSPVSVVGWIIKRGETPYPTLGKSRVLLSENSRQQPGPTHQQSLTTTHVNRIGGPQTSPDLPN